MQKWEYKIGYQENFKCYKFEDGNEEMFYDLEEMLNWYGNHAWEFVEVDLFVVKG